MRLDYPQLFPKTCSQITFLLCAVICGCVMLPREHGEPQSRLVTAILEAGGHFDDKAKGRHRKVDTVYLPKKELNRIRPTMLADFPNLRALMIIEMRNGEEVQLTGCLVDDLDDLLGLENAYRNAGWID